MVMSQGQHAGQNHDIKIDNKTFEMVEQFIYMETTLTNQSSIHKEIMSRLKSANSCYHSLQNLLSSCLLSKTTKTEIYRNIVDVKLVILN